MTARGRILQTDAGIDLPRLGQKLRGQKRIVQGIDDQGGHFDASQKLPAGAALPVIDRAAKTMQARRDMLIKIKEIARRAHPAHIEQSGKAMGQLQALALETHQEVAGIQATEPLLERHGTGLQALRRAKRNGCRNKDGVVSLLPQPFEQHIAAERDAGHQQGSC